MSPNDIADALDMQVRTFNLSGRNDFTVSLMAQAANALRVTTSADDVRDVEDLLIEALKFYRTQPITSSISVLQEAHRLADAALSQQAKTAGVPEGAETVYQITDAFEGDPKHTWRDATAGVYWSHPVSKRRILYRHISPPEAVGVPDRPCHVYNVEKRGSMCEWSPTTMAFALPDGVHALYTLATPPHPATAQPTTADDVRDAQRLDALSRPGWELGMNDDPECHPIEQWRVYRVSGGRNDREWALIGQGANPREAIDDALSQQAKEGGAA